MNYIKRIVGIPAAAFGRLSVETRMRDGLPVTEYSRLRAAEC